LDYVLDTSAAVVLIETCGLGSVLREFGQVHGLLVPSKVREEYLGGERPQRDIEAFEFLFQKVDVRIESVLLPYFHYDSESGEINVISYVMQNKDSSCCVIDEGFGRKICELVEVPVTGSVGIMLEMRKMTLLSSRDMRALRRRIRASNFYLSDQLLSQLR
jgi:predicted nucleic acid-binding protein